MHNLLGECYQLEPFIEQQNVYVHTAVLDTLELRSEIEPPLPTLWQKISYSVDVLRVA
jgi:hypothetical protein